jgi:hypothetical protein
MTSATLSLEHRRRAASHVPCCGRGLDLGLIHRLRVGVRLQ